MNVNVLRIHFVTCIAIIEIVHILLDFTPKEEDEELVYRGFLEYVVNARGSQFLMKGAPPWPQPSLKVVMWSALL